MTIVEQLKALSPQELGEVASLIAPHVSQQMLMMPRYFGDASRVHIGNNVVLINTMFNLSSGHIHVGDYSFFGHDVSLITGTHAIHKTNADRQSTIPSEGRDIVIEEGVWISSGVTVLGPCRIGAHAVIGVNSLVVTDVLPGWFYAGTPARPLKRIFKESDLQRLKLSEA